MPQNPSGLFKLVSPKIVTLLGHTFSTETPIKAVVYAFTFCSSFCSLTQIWFFPMWHGMAWDAPFSWEIWAGMSYFNSIAYVSSLSLLYRWKAHRHNWDRRAEYNHPPKDLLCSFRLLMKCTVLPDFIPFIDSFPLLLSPSLP